MAAFYCPVHIITGADCVKSNARIFGEFGGTALIVTGNSSAKNGSLADVEEVLGKNGQKYVLFGGVPANPGIDCVRRGAAMARECGADFVVAIGGGSPMDAAKAIALLARQNIPDDKLFSGKYVSDVLPMIHIPTTAGTGSEVTQYAILTDDMRESKTSIASPYIFPQYAFLDGRYMLTLGHNTTVNTAVDALSHALEGILSVKAGEISDLLAAEAAGIICVMFKKLSCGGLTLQDRNKLLYAATLAGMVIANTGTTAVHAMGYSLTYYKHIDHGRANGLLLGALMRYCEKKLPQRAEFALRACGYGGAEEFSDALSSLLGERETLTEEECAKYAKKAMSASNIANCAYAPDEADLYAMLKKSLGTK